MTANGTTLAPQPPPALSWAPAFRYYRYAQLADDLYESYRNLYLAFESILDDYVPSAGIIGDREWTKQALTAVAASGVDLRPYVASGTVHVIEALFREQYKARRCALFHAKTGRKSLIPGAIADRPKVLDAYGRLSQLVSLLLSQRFGVRQLTGGITPFGFSASIQALAFTARLGVTDTPSVTRPQIATAIGTRTDISRLDTTYKGAVDDAKPGREHEFRGRGKVARFLSPLVNSIVFWTSENEEGGEFAVEQLDLTGVDTFESRVIVMMNNRQMPRRGFAY